MYAVNGKDPYMKTAHTLFHKIITMSEPHNHFISFEKSKITHYATQQHKFRSALPKIKMQLFIQFHLTP